MTARMLRLFVCPWTVCQGGAWAEQRGRHRLQVSRTRFAHSLTDDAWSRDFNHRDELHQHMHRKSNTQQLPMTMKIAIYQRPRWSRSLERGHTRTHKDVLLREEVRGNEMASFVKATALPKWSFWPWVCTILGGIFRELCSLWWGIGCWLRVYGSTWSDHQEATFRPEVKQSEVKWSKFVVTHTFFGWCCRLFFSGT